MSEFIAAQVEFLLVGAYAMAAHDRPRATGDIDLWVRCDQQNAERIINALSRFGAPLGDVSARDFTTAGLVLQLGVAPYRIDLLTEIDGVEFDDAWRDRLEIEIEGLRISTLSREHLILNKRSTGRPKDAVDADRLEQRRASG